MISPRRHYNDESSIGAITTSHHRATFKVPGSDQRDIVPRGLGVVAIHHRMKREYEEGDEGDVESVSGTTTFDTLETDDDIDGRDGIIVSGGDTTTTA